MPRFDFIIIGAGIIGLTIAKELNERFPKAKILVLEKESQIGVHASGRNSGVLHSGVYYQKNSLKSKVCGNGARKIQQFCQRHKLPVKQIGKVIVPTDNAGDMILNELLIRAQRNSVGAYLVNEAELEKIEPDVKSYSGRALYVPSTAVINPEMILNKLSEELTNKGTKIVTGSSVHKIDISSSSLQTQQDTYHYGYLYNAAGLYADKIAHCCDVGLQYTVLPVKGSYKLLQKDSGIRCNGLIYPAPDLNMPFLGVHFTKTTEGEVYVGPTAGLSLSRENYSKMEQFKCNELFSALDQWGRLYMANKNNFRSYVNKSIQRWFLRESIKEATNMVPKLALEKLQFTNKVAIRAQLVDKVKKELVMDFLVLHKQNTTHVLNAVSPAFTSAFSFVKEFVVKI